MSFEEYWNDGFNDYDNVKESAEDAWDYQQQKINEALSKLDLAYPESWAYCVEETIRILKGEQE